MNIAPTYSRAALIALLKRSAGAKIVFTKTDGTERTLIATLDFETIPADKHPSGDMAKRVESLETVRCYDMENDGWRSFRIDSVISAE